MMLQKVKPLDLTRTFQDALGKLPELLGPEFLLQKVTLSLLMEAQAVFFEYVLTQDFGQDALARYAREHYQRRVTELRMTVALYGDELDQHEKYDLGAKLGFNLDVELRYHLGALTFWDLICLQINVFAPPFASSRPATSTKEGSSWN